MASHKSGPRNWKLQQELAKSGLRKCARCQNIKPLSAFYHYKHYLSTCKECHIETRREHYIKTSEKRKAYSRKYYRENREKVAEQNRSYRQKNKSEIARKKREYRAKNREKLCQKMREFHRRYKKKMVDMLGGKCTRCGYSKCIAALDFHHKNREEKEGEHFWRGHAFFETFDPSKYELLCANCHREIHNGEES